MTFKQRPEKGRVSQALIQGIRDLGRRNSTCKGPEEEKPAGPVAWGGARRQWDWLLVHPRKGNSGPSEGWRCGSEATLEKCDPCLKEKGEGCREIGVPCGFDFSSL